MVRELRVEEPEKEIPWETKCEFYYDYAIEGLPMPDNFRELLADDYRHLVPYTRSELSEAQRSWIAYRAWAGDISEDPRTPRERLEAYFKEQEEKA